LKIYTPPPKKKQISGYAPAFTVFGVGLLVTACRC